MKYRPPNCRTKNSIFCDISHKIILFIVTVMKTPNPNNKSLYLQLHTSARPVLSMLVSSVALQKYCTFSYIRAMELQCTPGIRFYMPHDAISVFYLITNIDLNSKRIKLYTSHLLLIFANSGGWSPNWVHSAPQPFFTVLLCLPRVIV
jgi:hypothetical protein